MSASVKSDIRGLKRLKGAIEALATKENKRELLAAIGALHEFQVRRRIKDEQTAPDGTKWQAWSDDYAKTRHGGQSLLQSDGDLLYSIDNQVKGSASVAIGSQLAYAGVIQDGFEGAVKVPAHIRRITQAFGKALRLSVNTSVSAFTRNMNTPARPYLGFSDANIKEMQTVIGDFWKTKL